MSAHRRKHDPAFKAKVLLRHCARKPQYPNSLLTSGPSPPALRVEEDACASGTQGGLLERLARCFTDYRDSRYIEHTVEELLGQRILALAQGYEDLNDHDALRDDLLLALAAGKQDLTGAQRARRRDRGHALAGKSTLNRLERTPEKLAVKERYTKIIYDATGIEELFTDDFIRAQTSPPAEVVLDLDATDDPLHGKQEGRFFHGFYGCYCYLPLYIFCGDYLLCAKLRQSNQDGAAGALDEVKRIVGQLRAVWPEVRITLRADSGFAREELMKWSEEHQVDYVFGLARNSRLEAMISHELSAAAVQSQESSKPVRSFKDLIYQTLTQTRTNAAISDNRGERRSIRRLAAGAS